MRFFRMDPAPAPYGLAHERWINAERVLELRVGQEIGSNRFEVWGLVAPVTDELRAIAPTNAPVQWETLFRHSERDRCLEWVRDVLEELR